MATTASSKTDVDDLKTDIDNLRADLMTLTTHIKDLGGAAVADAQKAGADKVDVLRSEIERTASQLKKHGEVSVAEVERTIQERPVLSLLAAFGAGMLVTRLLENR